MRVAAIIQLENLLGYVKIPKGMDLYAEQRNWFTGLLVMTEMEWRQQYPTFVDYLLSLSGVERVDVEKFTMHPYA